MLGLRQVSLEVEGPWKHSTVMVPAGGRVFMMGVEGMELAPSSSFVAGEVGQKFLPLSDMF